VSRATLVRAALALAVLALSTYVVLTRPPKLGLDLRGGTQVVLEARDGPAARADRAATDRVLEVLRRRVDALGVAEPQLTRSGERRIIVDLPGLQDPRQAVEVIGRTAQLTIHPVLGAGAADPGTAPADPRRERTVPDETGQPVRLGPAALDGSAVAGAEAAPDPQFGSGWQVTVDFRSAGERTWERLTADAACQPPGDPRRRVAIALDGRVISSPQVDPGVRCDVGITGGSTVITGRFTPDAARDLALLVSAGALPVPVDVVEQRTVGATLGAEAIRDSARAAVIGVLLTVLFVLAVYRLAGLLAAVALAAYGLISYAVLLALGATLTLPGIAGFVLAIGMAIDANVLVFERAREEYAVRGSLRTAVRDGFRGALSAVADSNVTTLLAAGLLFFLASGPVRGFGVTLSVGVLVSMFTALVLSRALLELSAASSWLARRPRWTGLGDIGAVRRGLLRRRPDLMRHRRRWLALSALLVAVAAAGIATRGLNLGVEFTGGRLVEYGTAQPVDVADARRVVAEAGVEQAVVQSSGDRQLTVRAGDLDDAELDRIRTGLATVGGETERVRDELIGPSLGSELRHKALIALGVALAAQLAYLGVRFRPAFGAAAVLAMAHDVLVLVGVFAWLGKPVDGVFLAALLTVVGYSVNDSVVVFDRVRELLRGRVGGQVASRRRGRSVADLATEACLQTLPRTVNTGLGALFVLTALAVLGGDTLTDFAVALLVGIVVGTWSSLFTATPLAVEFLTRWPGRGERARPATRPGGRPAPAAAGRRQPRDTGARL
jgi:SecD/SecF fusion protein